MSSAPHRRSQPLSTYRGRIELVMHSFWLHIHPPRVHRSSMAFGRTWYAGFISFHLFLILLVTGIALMLYYTPSPERAYRDMKDLEFLVVLGGFLRNLHRWSAHAMIVLVFLHMCRVFWTAAYRRPRQVNWVIGVGLLVLTLLLSFTGYLLPWDQLAFWAITVGTNIGALAPSIGPYLKEALLGGHTVAAPSLLRFYVLHCVILPCAMAALLMVHFWRVRKDGGLAESLQAPAADPLEPAYPFAFLRQVNLFLAASALVMIASLVWNAPLEDLANPTKTPNPAKAPWYFLGLQEMVSYHALVGGVVAPALMLALAFALPYIDRNQQRAPSRRVIAIASFGLVLFANLVLIVIGVWFRGEEWKWIVPWRSAGGS